MEQMKRIKLGGKAGEAGLHILVDDADYRWLKGTSVYLRGKYAAIWLGRDVYLHTIFMPKRQGLETDHINQNKLDNRRANLRYVTRGENKKNSSNKHCKSGIRGVTFHGDPPHKPWRANAQFGGRYCHLGCYATKEEAAAAYVNFQDRIQTAPETIKLPKQQRKPRAGK